MTNEEFTNMIMSAFREGYQTAMDVLKKGLPSEVEMKEQLNKKLKELYDKRRTSEGL